MGGDGGAEDGVGAMGVLMGMMGMLMGSDGSADGE